ncbi:hypothetical protein F5J12DRAFT_814450 [Pisolithus orientalis]|uniref:uncharacterized protein n=1 Tax=Pisolithus orientalis TaxID=936130 RepID=UPI002224707C|nr:uncharacterized protein F5J12DRAFT_814450 [Pisolithus orientalis]KAI6019966.1 hypothetical protein F5J12DRAFT_814450 [Pisolithus orientalis]
MTRMPQQLAIAFRTTPYQTRPLNGRSSSSDTNSAALMDDRSSLDTDSERGSTSSPAAHPAMNGRAHTPENGDDSESLQRKLRQALEEKENLSTQYHSLLAKLTAMRTSLGTKLKQDAEELDRREQQIQQLGAQNEDLVSTVETLKAELIASHEEAERTTRELDSMRSRALSENAQETIQRERELRETMGELERCRIDRDEWEQAAMQDKVAADEARSMVESLRRDLEIEHEARDRELAQLEAAKLTASNLQSVLEDFQIAKEHELQQAVKDYKSRLDEVTLSLAEYKRRALDAELQLEETKTSSSRTQELERELKEKNAIVGKLRHQNVILNEHLIEALRRLRRNSSDTNVDRQLVTNVLLSFLSTPRADSKRFEMLSLLATILSWSDAERERAGLQRAQSNGANSSPSLWSRSSNVLNSPSKRKSIELEKTDETESFSRLWVEFLLTEANQGETQTHSESQTTPTKPFVRANASSPGSPSHSSSHIPASPSAGFKGTRRLASLTSVAAAASSPSLPLGSPPPSRKGKEKEIVP